MSKKTKAWSCKLEAITSDQRQDNTRRGALIIFLMLSLNNSAQTTNSTASELILDD
jgi:hypothetical protein